MDPRQRRPKRHYYILLNGAYVGESWAVSAAKAINNYWWKNVKQYNEYNTRLLNPADFDAVEE